MYGSCYRFEIRATICFCLFPNNICNLLCIWIYTRSGRALHLNLLEIIWTASFSVFNCFLLPFLLLTHMCVYMCSKTYRVIAF